MAQMLGKYTPVRLPFQVYQALASRAAAAQNSRVGVSTIIRHYVIEGLKRDGVIIEEESSETQTT